VNEKHDDSTGLQDEVAAEALSSAPESGQPSGGREPAPEESDRRGPPDTPPPEASGEDF
jgi:hypothetical protein